MKEVYTMRDFQNRFHLSRPTIINVLNKYGVTSKKIEGVGNISYYDKKAYEVLSEQYSKKVKIEIIQVPVYVNVNWEIIPSKMNYLKDCEL